MKGRVSSNKLSRYGSRIDNTSLTSSLGDEHGPGDQTLEDDDKGNRNE